MTVNQRILLGVYGGLIFVFGILCVPAYAIWGPEKNILTFELVPIWKLVKHDHEVNGFTPFYQLDYGRVILVIGVLTLITAVFYLILGKNERSKQK